MLRLSFLILVINLTLSAQKSPHGKSFNIDCEDCHSQSDWKIILTEIRFDHNKTNFELLGQHKFVNCKSCHTDLKFEKTKTECISCHSDIHRRTLGDDCKRCHTSFSWSIEDINKIHNNSRFPLVGKHRSLNCLECHKYYSILKFEVVDTECYNCHKSDFQSASNPNHILANFPKTCSNCHSIHKPSWGGNFNHDFFPLIGGHSIKQCSTCHTGNVFSQLDKNCESCHLNDFNSTQNPNHIKLGIKTSCFECHDIMAWNLTKFNHSQTRFALTGSHLSVSCESCHFGRTIGTSTICFDCHQTNFNRTTNPNHTRLGISTECNLCHTTNPDWKPAQFPIHNNFFALTGKHNVIRNDCFSCHKGSYFNTPRECLGCHLNNYNQTTSPNHSLLQFPIQCETCHTTNGWTPSTFNHDQLYFPIYSGKHRNTWSDCRICHTNPSNYSVFSCLNCHEHQKERMDDKHRDVVGYIYQSEACLNCHPNGTKPNSLKSINRFEY